MSNKPAHKIQLGNLKATIWANYSAEKGTTWYSVNVSRGYKDSDDKWRDTESLGFDDLLTAAKLLDLTHTWIMHRMQADYEARKQQKAAAAA